MTKELLEQANRCYGIVNGKRCNTLTLNKKCWSCLSGNNVGFLCKECGKVSSGTVCYVCAHDEYRKRVAQERKQISHELRKSITKTNRYLDDLYEWNRENAHIKVYYGGT